MKKIILFSLFLLGFASLKAENKPFVAIANVSDTTFQIYVGVYKLEENVLSETYSIIFEGGKLYGQAVGYDKTELTKQADPHAFKSGYGSDVVFSQETEGGPFNKVKLVVQGNTVMGTKQ
jgi:hypothetical protein